MGSQFGRATVYGQPDMRTAENGQSKMRTNTFFLVLAKPDVSHSAKMGGVYVAAVCQRGPAILQYGLGLSERHVFTAVLNVRV